MPNLIEERVALAWRGESPFVISRPTSGWLVIGDVQPLPVTAWRWRIRSSRSSESQPGSATTGRTSRKFAPQQEGALVERLRQHFAAK
ncbi:MAG: hypothetical protein U1E60_05495 [Reyranellaceae bacterium]